MSRVNTKYLTIDWNSGVIRHRRLRFRHNRRVHSIYVQVLWLEVGVWYR